MSDDIRHILWWLTIALSVMAAVWLLGAIDDAFDESWFAMSADLACAAFLGISAIDTHRRKAKYRETR